MSSNIHNYPTLHNKHNGEDSCIKWRTHVSNEEPNKHTLSISITKSGEVQFFNSIFTNVSLEFH